MRKQAATPRDRAPQVAGFEACEPRLVMSAQPLDTFALEAFRVETTLVPATQTTYAHAMTGLDVARNQYGFTGAGQTVAVIDTGIGYDHLALGGGFGSGYRVVGGWDFAENDANPYDDRPGGSHGTHVAGIIGSTDSRYQGVAPGVDLVALRVFDDQGQGSFAWIEQALRWVHKNRNAFENPITTVNLSIGAAWNSTKVPGWATLEDEFAQLKAAGIFVAVAAGNSFAQYNKPGLSYPASGPSVVPVMAVDATGALSSFSQRHTSAIAAPGRSIMSTVPDYRGNQNTRADDFVSYSGTSMASPYVAGAAALIREAYAFIGKTNVNQNQIESLMRKTADRIHDAITGRTYLSLNVDAALDRIMPKDEYGNSTGTAFALADMTGKQTLRGWISSRTDTDNFTFTASQTGTLLITTQVLRGDMRAEWTLDASQAAVDGKGRLVLNVTSGETYTLRLDGGGGMGRYKVTLNLNGTVPKAVNWGQIDQRQIDNQSVGNGRDEFAVTATRGGTLTIEAGFQHAAGNIDLAVYDAAGRLLGASRGSGDQERVDVQVSAGQTVYLRVSGTNSDVDFRVTNLVSVAGSSVSVFGTAGSDVFSIAVDATHAMSVNGVEYRFDARQYHTFEFFGQGGRDSISMRGGQGADTATLRQTSAELSGQGYLVRAQGIGTVVIDGGGGTDTATLHDSQHDDQLTGGADGVRLTGKDFDHSARGFARTRVEATQGNDRATLVDSAGNDTLVGQLGESRFSGPGFEIVVVNFDSVQATAGAGFDQAFFYGSAGRELFEGAANQSRFSGSGFEIVANAFDRVRAYGDSGQDAAVLIDPGTGATLTNQPNYNLLRGEGFDILAYNCGTATVRTPAVTAPAHWTDTSGAGGWGWNTSDWQSALAMAWQQYLRQSDGMPSWPASDADELDALDRLFSRYMQGWEA
jgi:hypothetical protein